MGLPTPTFLIAILISLSVHEWAHAVVADRLGDKTPRAAGRLTLNPLAHLSLEGTLAFILLGFGWAKPVPINPLSFRRWRFDNMLVALAGPGSNLVLALLTAVIMALILGPNFDQQLTEGTPLLLALQQLGHNMIGVNLVLMAFNLLPIPPLDGSRMLPVLIPQSAETMDRMEHSGLLPIIVLVLVDMAAQSLLGFSLIGWWIDVVTTPIERLFDMIMGIV